MGSGGGGNAPAATTPDKQPEVDPKKNPATEIGTRTQYGFPGPTTTTGYLDSSGRDAQIDSLLNAEYEKKNTPGDNLIG